MTAIQTTIRIGSSAVSTRSQLLVGAGKRVCCSGGVLVVSDLACGPALDHVPRTTPTVALPRKPRG